MKGSTPYRMLVALSAEDETSEEILSFFQPTCDCSATDYVQNKILAADATTIAVIKEMIEADPYDPPRVPTAFPTGTVLVATSCTGTNLMGTYLLPTGGTVQQQIQANSSLC